MQVSVAGLRRNIKNIAHNYTEPQVIDDRLIFCFLIYVICDCGLF